MGHAAVLLAFFLMLISCDLHDVLKLTLERLKGI